MRTSASTNTLDNLINTAININTKLHELQLELRNNPQARLITQVTHPYHQQGRNNNLRQGQRGNHYQSNIRRCIHNNISSRHYRPIAIDLSNLNKGPKQ
jgi:hypothetical protein